MKKGGWRHDLILWLICLAATALIVGLQWLLLIVFEVNPTNWVAKFSAVAIFPLFVGIISVYAGWRQLFSTARGWGTLLSLGVMHWIIWQHIITRQLNIERLLLRPGNPGFNGGFALLFIPECMLFCFVATWVLVPAATYDGRYAPNRK